MSEDDPGIAPDVRLYRLVNPENHVVWDDNDRRWAISSSAFQNTSGTDRMSVVLGDTLAAERRPPHDARRSKPTWHVAALTAEAARAEDQAVVRAPVPEESAHGNVVGEKGPGRRRRLRDASEWVVPPDPPGA